MLKRTFTIDLWANKNVDVVKLFRTISAATKETENVSTRDILIDCLAGLVKGVSSGISGNFSFEERTALRTGNFERIVSDDGRWLWLTLNVKHPTVVTVEFIPNKYNQVDVIGKMTTEKEVKLFSFFPDELSFSANDIIGLTEEEALNLFLRADRQYLIS